MTKQKRTIQDSVRTLSSADVLKQSIVDCICRLGTAVVNDTEQCQALRVEKDLSAVHEQLLYFVYRLVFIQLVDINGSHTNIPLNLSTILETQCIWEKLLKTMEQFWDEGNPVDMTTVDTGLWSPSSCSLIAKANLSDPQCRAFIVALTQTCENQSNRAVDWQSLTSRDLSTTFESILELVPSIATKTGAYILSIKKENTRKSSGSYYTPDGLIDRVLNSTLVPALDNAIGQLPKSTQGDALLRLSVCDPSCGSGNFLVAAARLLADRLTDIRMKEGLQQNVVYQEALKDVLTQCIYGVDINPMTVELCKMVLWIELGDSNQSLSLFNDTIRCGNALLGATPALIENGIQTEYFELIPVRDDSKIRNAIAKKNRLDLKGLRRVQTGSKNYVRLLNPTPHAFDRQ